MGDKRKGVWDSFPQLSRLGCSLGWDVWAMVILSGNTVGSDQMARAGHKTILGGGGTGMPWGVLECLHQQPMSSVGGEGCTQNIALPWWGCGGEGGSGRQERW